VLDSAVAVFAGMRMSPRSGECGYSTAGPGFDRREADGCGLGPTLSGLPSNGERMIRLARLKRFLLQGAEGAALVEYALLVTLIAIVSVATIRVLGSMVSSFFATFASSI
jgi:Flp pilus assembly pilin Flp